ncbi:MAG: hypothetical protein JKY81_06690 [Colwellia sp.]|nr:hypothetical protein [Colwellia sp.]
MKPEKNMVSAVRTNEGFIEITSLELLDEMVGGLINPDAIFCQLEEESHSPQKHLATETGI